MQRTLFFLIVLLFALSWSAAQNPPGTSSTSTATQAGAKPPCPVPELETQPRLGGALNKTGSSAPSANPAGETIATNGGRSPQAIGGPPARIFEQTTPTADTPARAPAEPNQPNVLPPWVVQAPLEENFGICQPARATPATHSRAAASPTPAPRAAKPSRAPKK